AESVPLAVEE
ncbi:hypothetical protein A2U01_0106918, partial [Trifolium medium]|nr:hypothetical protein [Trifolium medium]